MADLMLQQKEVSDQQQNYSSVDISLLIAKLRSSIWLVGIPSWLFGITDRSFAAFADGYLSSVELFQLLTASFFFISWLYLKPEESMEEGGLNSYRPYDRDGLVDEAQSRMFELRKYHLISQEYVLPFPYICQIYHLLNLKHLEHVHGFSLNNLRIIKVSDVEPTSIGGIIRFQTVLESPMNALRIWRQPIVEVELVLRNPYTVELRIPVYGQKKIIVMFNVQPLNETEHKLFIDIYSNLGWPKPIMQVLLHVASCLTLFEDLPYLRQLAERNLQRLVRNRTISSHDTMWLFKRFVDLYGSGLESYQSTQYLPAATVES